MTGDTERPTIEEMVAAGKASESRRHARMQRIHDDYCEPSRRATGDAPHTVGAPSYRCGWEECTCNFCVTGERDGLGHDDAPTPFELWEAADGDRNRYLALMREYGHIVPGKRPPGEDIFGHRVPIDVSRLAKALVDSGLMKRYADYANSLPTMRHGTPEELAQEWAQHIAREYGTP